MPHGVVTGIIFALTPTVLVGLIFWFAMRAILHSDRTERAAYSKIEAAERARFEREHPGILPASSATVSADAGGPSEQS